MAYNVKFLKGTASEYAAVTKDANTFYYVDEEDLYLGDVKLSNGADLAAAILRIAINEANIGTLTNLTTVQKSDLVSAINELKSEVSALTGGETGGISDMIAAITGNLTDLTTIDKTNLVEAINELKDEIGSNKTASAVTVTEDTTDSSVAKKYIISQGGTQISTINIPKDMVVSSAQIVNNPEGQTAGKYIELTIANNDGSKIYINVNELVDAYTAAASATQIQLIISDSNEISASVVAGSIGATELASNAVTTIKIGDKQVTKAKLSEDVQESLEKANSAEDNAKAYTDSALTWGSLPNV